MTGELCWWTSLGVRILSIDRIQANPRSHRKKKGENDEIFYTGLLRKREDMRTHTTDIKSIILLNVLYWVNRSQVTAHYDLSKDNFVPKQRDQFEFNVERFYKQSINYALLTYTPSL